jgi:hypothetical protein
MGHKMNTYRILVGDAEEKRALERPRIILRWQRYPQSSSTLWNYSKCGVYTVESEAGC